jgi:hypothetical protein
MVHFIGAFAGYLFGCHHKALSRVFTIGHRTYQVCCECGAEFEYSLKKMSTKGAIRFGSLRNKHRDRNAHQPIPAGLSECSASLLR